MDVLFTLYVRGSVGENSMLELLDFHFTTIFSTPEKYVIGLTGPFKHPKHLFKKLPEHEKF